MKIIGFSYRLTRPTPRYHCQNHQYRHKRSRRRDTSRQGLRFHGMLCTRRSCLPKEFWARARCKPTKDEECKHLDNRLHNIRWCRYYGSYTCAMLLPRHTIAGIQRNSHTKTSSRNPIYTIKVFQHSQIIFLTHGFHDTAGQLHMATR